MNSTRRGLLGSHALLVVAVLAAVVPLVLMWLTALKAPSELAANPFGLPDEWQWGNFARAWSQGKFGSYLWSSVVVVVPVVVASVALSVLAGYAFARFRFRGATVLFLGLLVGIMIPTEGIVIPLYHVLRDAGLVNTRWALILPQVALSTSFGTFWLRAFFRGVPEDLVDAAAVDGAGPLRTLWHVLLPMARPALGTLAVLIFLWTWNEFLLALVLVQDESVRTLPVGLAFFQGQRTAQVPLLAAAATIVSAPVLVVYAALHRRFVEGLASGGVKG